MASPTESPLLPRLHLFEIEDQSWFPPFLRRYSQHALSFVWTTVIPFVQSAPPAAAVASLLTSHLGPSLGDHTYVDFCAGAGGPTPHVERYVNAALASRGLPPVDFVLTDLHPHVPAWERAVLASASGHLSFEPRSINAAAVPDWLGRRGKSGGGGSGRGSGSGSGGGSGGGNGGNGNNVRINGRGSNSNSNGDITRNDGKGLFRLFNLSFHHFDDPLARSILRNTIATSDGLAIFELQDRHWTSFLSVIIFGLAVFVAAPWYAVRYCAPLALFFCWVVPVLPVSLVLDGWVSALRTRTPDEVDRLARECGGEKERREWETKWEMRSGRVLFLPPLGYLNWIICRKVKE